MAVEKLMATICLYNLFSFFSLLFCVKRRQRARKILLKKRREIRRQIFNSTIKNYAQIQCILASRRFITFSLPRRNFRQTWIVQRKTDIWKDVSLWSPKDWHDNLRMSRGTFNHICDMIRPRVERKTTRFRAAIPVEKRVMLTLWKLATVIEFRTLSILFGVGRSTAFSIFYSVLYAINEVIGPRYLTFPTGESLRRVVDGFKRRWSFPQCAGAIDGTHIPITAPKEHPSDYVNRKKFHSIILQAVCDDNGVFTNINVGQPGKHHDAFVLATSPLYRQVVDGLLLPSWSEDLNGVNVPLVILADPAYPLSTWLMKGYPGGGSNEDQRYFNYRLSRARMAIDCAFGRLKGRWRCLRKTIEAEVINIPAVVSACCILHNVCQTHGEFYDNEWDKEDDSPCPLPVPRSADSEQGKLIRDALCNYFSN